MSERNSADYMEILLVEDNQGDVLLTKRALKSGKVLHNVHVANDGEAALASCTMSNTGRLRAQI